MMWVPLDGTVFAAITSTTASRLYGLQAPTVTIGTDLTADPPEDVTILRVTADLSVTLSSAGCWVLALLVQDTTWSPASTYTLDADKRVLWHKTYDTNGALGALAGFVSATWECPNHLTVDATTDLVVECQPDAVQLDCTPKVRLEDGKGLHLVAYEQSGAAAMTCVLRNMRLLMKRSGRR